MLMGSPPNTMLGILAALKCSLLGHHASNLELSRPNMGVKGRENIGRRVWGVQRGINSLFELHSGYRAHSKSQ